MCSIFGSLTNNAAEEENIENCDFVLNEKTIYYWGMNKVQVLSAHGNLVSLMLRTWMYNGLHFVHIH